MPSRPTAAPLRRWSTRLLTRLSVVGLAAGLAAVPALREEPAPTSAADLVPAAAPALPSDRPTTIRISSFNVLGHSHTAKGGNKYRKGWADGRTRMRMASQLVVDNGLDVVGFQELQKPQWEEFTKLQADRYRLYPSNEMGSGPMQNSIAWDYTKWYAVQKLVQKVPYFHGTQIPMPYVQLRNRETGRMVWVYNTHQAADVRGPAQKYRDEAVRREVALVNRLERDYPGEPIFSVGDKNDFSRYHCPIVTRSDLRSASGGGVRGGKCVNPKGMLVDWVMGNSQVRFTGYSALRTPTVRRITDHPVVVASATLPSARVAASGIQHVVVVNVSGLSSTRLASVSSSTMPNLTRLRREGVSTLNARTAYERVSLPANTFGILTSRPVDRRSGGTGVDTSNDTGGTVHRAAGRYAASVFDMVADHGKRAGFWSTHRTTGARVLTSYDGADGRADRFGLDEGRKKIARGAVGSNDYRTTTSLVADMRSRPKALQYVQLDRVDQAARASGPMSSAYTAALRQVDVHLGRILRAIDGSSKMRGRTVVILTSDHGGMLAGRLAAKAGRAYTVPFVVWGRGVPRGVDLYRLNTHFADPEGRRPAYTATLDPIRNSYAGNLATKLLGLPAISGSNMDAGQTMTVFSG